MSEQQKKMSTLIATKPVDLKVPCPFCAYLSGKMVLMLDVVDNIPDEFTGSIHCDKCLAQGPVVTAKEIANGVQAETLMINALTAWEKRMPYNVSRT